MLESKRRAAIFLILAFLLAAAAGYLVLDKVRDLNAELGGMTEIYVAKGDIPARTPIQEGQITTVEIPNKFHNEKSHIEDKEDILHKVPIVSISEGQIITANILKNFSSSMDENNRLISMYPSEKVQFDQGVEAFDRVDIIVSTNDNGQEKTEIFMKDVLVSYAKYDESENKKEDPILIGTALEISLEEAPKLIHAQHYADKVRILKANVGKDDSVVPIKEKAVEPAKQEPVKTEENATQTQPPAAEQPAQAQPPATEQPITP